MKTKPTHLAFYSLLIFTLSMSCTKRQETDAWAEAHEEIVRLQLQNNSDALLIYHAAAAFFKVKNSSNQVTVLSLYSLPTNAPPVAKKYVDGNYAVLVLPVPVGAGAGFFKLAELYNWQVVALADRFAMNDEFQKAIEIYHLVENCAGSGPLLPDIEQRLLLVELLQKGINVESNTVALGRLLYTPAPSFLGAELPVDVIPTSNLLTIEFKERWKSPIVHIENHPR